MPMRSSLHAAACMTLVAAMGCSNHPEIAPVSGRVTIDGAPLTVGFVRFVPAGARSSTGKLNAQGEYRLTCLTEGDGAIVGEHQVEIVATEVLTSSTIKHFVPKKYANGRTSTLTCSVPAGGRDDADFELTWDGGEPFVETIQGSGSKKPQAPEASGPFGAPPAG